ncbi:hypothetical protein GF413_05230 [Candidatus Micrarchaeota archaeon]|nr:hypothetical protein [Candidatus Micrarchaeota archaeon]
MGTTTPSDEGAYPILATTEICPSSEEAFFIPDWQTYVAAAVAASSAILAFLYLFYHFFNNDTGKATVKLEIFELFTTIFIIIIVIALMNSSCAVPMGSLISPEETADMNLFDAAAYVLDDFSDSLVIVSTILHTLYIPMDFITTTTLSQHPLGMGTSLQPTAGFGAVLRPIFVNGLQSLTVAFIVVRAQLIILDFLSFAMIKYYLPIGILMRSFSPTRRIGGTLIGLVVGLVLVYPYLIVLNGYMIFPMHPFQLDYYTSSMDSLVSSAWDWEALTEFQSQSLSLSGGVLTLFTFFEIVIGGIVGTVFGLYLALMMRTVAVGFLIGLFFPALNMLILVTVVRYLTKTFGEEIDISNLSRMI